MTQVTYAGAEVHISKINVLVGICRSNLFDSEGNHDFDSLAGLKLLNWLD